LTEEQKQRLDELRARRPRPARPRGESPAGGRLLDDGGSIPPPPSYMRERVLADLPLPPSLAPPHGDPPPDKPYFLVWRPDGSPLKAAPESETQTPAMPVVREANADELQFQQRALVREAWRRGPHETIILVGRPVARELNDLSSFAWRLAGTGCLTLVVGLAGGWVISRGIVRPISRISA